MSTPAHDGPASPPGPPASAPSAPRPRRPFYWSVRREVWEHRSLHIAPLVVAAVVLLASLATMVGLPRRMRTLPADPARAHAVVVRPFSLAPAPIMLVTFVVGLVYALDALYGERRDRSTLFWKSLPVSDRTTVLAKAAVPIVLLPAIALALSLATLAVILSASTLVLAASGVGAGTLWREVHFVQEPLIMLYGLAAHALWFAPIYAWLLLVSAWARRTPVLWAALPLFSIAAVERIVFGSARFASLLCYRVSGAMEEAFAVMPSHGGPEVLDSLLQLTPLRFLGSAGLWSGLLAAAAFLALAVRLRRYHEPI